MVVHARAVAKASPSAGGVLRARRLRVVQGRDGLLLSEGHGGAQDVCLDHLKASKQMGWWKE